MKKLFKLLLVMFALYLLIQMAFRFFGKGYSSDYEIKINDHLFAKIHEVYTNRVKNEKKNYFVTIDVGNNKFFLQTYRGFGYASQIIKKVDYYQGTYTCIYPTFKKYKQLTDVLCLDQGVVKNYQDLVGKDTGLDAFVKKLEEENKYINTFKDDISGDYHINSFTVYPKNLINNHYIAVNNYHGLYTISTTNPRKLYDVKLFKEDAYERTLTALTNEYYMSANYDEEYEFKQIDIVNITNNKNYVMELSTPISFESYIQGVVDGEVYLIDKSNKKQYKINVKDRVIHEVGNENTPTSFYDKGVWKKKTIYEVANEEQKFNMGFDYTPNSGYLRVDKLGNEKSGYFYYYKQQGSNYQVYRASIQSPSQLHYLFTTPEIDHITYIDDYVYYYIHNRLMVYGDLIGNRSILQNGEYEFNKTLNYYIYKKG